MTIPSACEPFKLGANLAWRVFGLDIGGGAAGAAANSGFFLNAFQDMAEDDVSIVRVWLYADLRSPGIQFDGNDCVTGLTGSTFADLAAIAQAAATAGVQIMWTLLAHNAFDTDAAQGVARPKLYPSVLNAQCRQMFMNNLVGPVVAAIANDPNYAATFHSYDLFNEPDWAIVDANPINPSQPWPISDYNQQEFDQAPLTYQQMRDFLAAMATTTRANDPDACITIGTAGTKWASAWEPLVDINTPHQYNWSQAYFPADQPPSNWGLSKPTFVGEYPPLGMNNGDFPESVAGALPKTHIELLCEWTESGYSGALAWAYTDPPFGYTEAARDAAQAWHVQDVQTFVDVGIAPSSLQCDATATLTVSPRSAKGEPIEVDPATFTATQGEIAGVNYNPADCTYTIDYIAPKCPSDVTVAIRVDDLTGQQGSGSIVIGDSDIVCTDTGATVTHFVGDCQVVPFTITCESCSCKPDAPVLLTNNNPLCPVKGDVFMWRLPGCDCVDANGDCRCGPVKAYFKDSSRRETACIDGDILTVGPIKISRPLDILVKCGDCPATEC